MTLLLSKIVAAMAMPLGFAILLLIGSECFQKHRAIRRALAGAAMAVLWSLATPLVSTYLVRAAEGLHPPSDIANAGPGDVAVLLGGVLGQPVPPRADPDLGEAADRVIDAWRLYRLQRVPKILVSGGNLPWEGAVAPEAVLIKRLLVELGVPADDILTETESRNTRENAVNSAAKLKAEGMTSVLLVTSAAHMTRASGAFSQVGINPIPVPTDFHAPAQLSGTLLDYLPDAESLQRTTEIIREWVGLAYYKIRGWA